MLHRDFRELLSAFSDAEVEYLLVGAYALAAHGFVRATNDLVLWVRPSPENARRVHGALLAFGAPNDRFSIQDFVQPDMVVQLGVPPARIDILTSISGVDFTAAWNARQSIDLDGITVPALCLAHMTANKRASGRDQDMLDLKWIERNDKIGD